MKVNKELFSKFGIDCKRYSDFIESLEDGEGKSAHHIYPRALFNSDEVIHITNEHHTMAHILLALDCSEAPLTPEIAKIIRGARARINFDKETVIEPELLEKVTLIIQKSVSLTTKIQWSNSETKEKMINGIKSTKQEQIKDSEYQRTVIPKYRKAQIELWKDPVYRENQIAALRAGWGKDSRKRQSDSKKVKYSTLEMKDKLSKAAQKRCSDSDYIERIKETKKTPMVRKKYAFFHLWEHLVKLSKDNLPLDYCFSKASKGKLNLMFNYFGYLLEALGISPEIINKYKELYPPRTEQPFSEDLVVWSKMTDSEWIQVKEYLNKILSL